MLLLSERTAACDYIVHPLKKLERHLVAQARHEMHCVAWIKWLYTAFTALVSQRFEISPCL